MQAAEAIMITDGTGRIQYVNPAFATITGYGREEVEGENPRLLKSGRHDGPYYSALWNTITAGLTWKGRMVNRKKDGTEFTAEGTISPVLSPEGEVVNFVAVSRDITEDLRNKEQVRQAQKMEAIGALAGGIAHDFNNILSPIVGYAEMLREDLPEAGTQQEYLGEILQATNRARELVRQILSFSRQGEQARTAVRLQGILGEVLKLVQATLPSTIAVHTDIDEGCGHVLADPTRIHQVMMNLVTNAFHAMEAEGGRLTLSLAMVAGAGAGQGSSAGNYARLRVSDTGQGMEKPVMARIFEPYFTTKTENKGTGLGLSVVHGIVRSFGGTIHVESEVGVGTTFEVRLPCISAGEESARKRRHAEVHLGGTEHILLVDDEPSIIQMQGLMLRRLGYRVTGRTASTEAIALFRDRPGDYDLVITDMTMPDLTGDRLAREIKEIAPEKPVIICTGFSERMSEEQAMAMGIDGYVKKPVLKLELASLIRRLLDGTEKPLIG